MFEFLAYFIILISICLSTPVAMGLIYGVLRLIPKTRHIMDAASVDTCSDGAA